jgi:hypothetical protein
LRRRREGHRGDADAARAEREEGCLKDGIVVDAQPVVAPVATHRLAVPASWLASFSNAFGGHTETVTSLAFLLGYVLDAIVALVLVRRRHTLPPPDRQRMVWVICGCAIGLPAFVLLREEVAELRGRLRALQGTAA